MPKLLQVAACSISLLFPAPSIAQDIPAAANANDRAFVAWQFKTLRDPDSAKWQRTKDPFTTTVTLKRGLLGKQQWTGELACYALNAKNAYGAYVGYTPHAVLITSSNQV